VVWFFVFFRVVKLFFFSGRRLIRRLGGLTVGLPGLRNTGHWQCQCLWHNILSYLHMHCPVLLSFLSRTKNQYTGQSG